MSKPIHWPGHKYLGPGSKDLTAEPVDEDDRIAQTHDLDYELAETVKDIRSADRRAISAFICDFLTSGNYHSAIGALGLSGKYALERVLGRPLYPNVNSLNRQSYRRYLYLLRQKFLSNYAKSNSISFKEAQQNQDVILRDSEGWKQELESLCLQFLTMESTPASKQQSGTPSSSIEQSNLSSSSSAQQSSKSTTLYPFDMLHKLTSEPIDQVSSDNTSPDQPKPLARDVAMTRNHQEASLETARKQAVLNSGKICLRSGGNGD